MTRVIKEEESDDSVYATEPHDEFGKLACWAKKHFAHYRPRLLPDHVWAAYLCSPYPDIIRHAVTPNNIDPEDFIA